VVFCQTLIQYSQGPIQNIQALSKRKALICFTEAEKIVLIMNDLNSYEFSFLYAAFLPGEERHSISKLAMRHTPRYDCLNMAEIELSALPRQCLKAHIPNQVILTEQVAARENRRTASEPAVCWRLTTEDARIKSNRRFLSIDAY